MTDESDAIPSEQADSPADTDAVEQNEKLERSLVELQRKNAANEAKIAQLREALRKTQLADADKAYEKEAKDQERAEDTLKVLSGEIDPEPNDREFTELAGLMAERDRADAWFKIIRDYDWAAKPAEEFVKAAKLAKKYQLGLATRLTKVKGFPEKVSGLAPV